MVREGMGQGWGPGGGRCITFFFFKGNILWEHFFWHQFFPILQTQKLYFLLKTVLEQLFSSVIKELRENEVLVATCR